MKIAILADPLDLQNAGIHVYVRGLVNAIAEIETENEYILVRPKEGHDFSKLREVIVPIKTQVPGHQRIRGFTSIPARMKKEEVDIVLETAHFGPFRLPKHIRRVTLIHDLTPILFPSFHPKGSVWAHLLLLKRILRKADLILTNSKHTEKDVHQYSPTTKTKTAVLYPGREMYFSSQKNKNNLKKYNIQHPYLLSVGTLEPRKNLIVLLKAYEMFRDQFDETVQLVLIGQPGWKNVAFEKQLAGSKYRKDILQLGFVPNDDLPGLYSIAEMFVYPSIYEGFGLPVLEAMSCGAPVLISDRSSLPEVGGKAAAYFEPCSENDLSKKIIRLLNDKKRLTQMSELSFQQSLMFDWKKSALLLDKLLTTL